MQYHSTRNETIRADSAQAVLEGLAPDGGLYMPQTIPAFDWQQCLQGSSQPHQRIGLRLDQELSGASQTAFIYDKVFA